jgi:gamma-glutamyltranspeptidase / glutathione hydrolase
MNNRQEPKARIMPAALAAMSAVAAAALLSACETTAPAPEGTVGHVAGFYGAVAADEPEAVEVARQVLSAGGTAADAAVALNFTLAVTLPSRASLGAGGMCLVFDAPTQTVQALEFVPQASATVAGKGPAPIAVPGGARAMFALHSKYGKLLWQQLLAPAEKLARSGSPVSKTLARDLLLAQPVVTKDPETMRVLGHKDGTVMREGEMVTQADLGVLIGSMRDAGPGEFYDGMLAPAVARRYAEAGESAATAISADDLRDYQPEWLDPIRVPYQQEVLNFAPPPAAAGVVAAESWMMLAQDDRYRSVRGADRLHLLAEVSMRAYGDRARWMNPDGTNSIDMSEVVTEDRVTEMMSSYNELKHTPAGELNPVPVAVAENPAATSYVVADRQGSAVACSLTMNNLFGLGHMVRGTGIMAAAAPLKGSGNTALAPMIVVNEDSSELMFAASASGGAAAPEALLTVAIENVMSGRPLHQALVTKRVVHTGTPDVLVYEKGLAPEFVQALTERGHKMFEVESLGSVTVISCPKGLPDNPDSCAAATEPRGTGRAFTSKS